MSSSTWKGVELSWKGVWGESCHEILESGTKISYVSINWVLSMWLIMGMIESCVGPKEPYREVSLLVEMIQEDNRSN